MKKILSIIICLCAMSMASFALPNASVLLQHKGFVTVYPLDSLNAALNDAVNGDTLFLSKGTYPGFTINKQLTIRGEGEDNTIVTGQVTVAIPDSLPLKATVLEGLYLQYTDYGQYSIRVNQAVCELKIKQCEFRTISFDGAKLYNVLIDRCRCYSRFELSFATFKSMIVKNSQINELYFGNTTLKDMTFVNCNIRGNNYSGANYLGYFRGSFINCILSGGSSGTTLESVTLINTLHDGYKISNTAYTENCYVDTNPKDLIWETSLRCAYKDTELLEKGYIGDDGTIVGCNGGSTPYTLTLAVPVVTSSDVKLDAEQRKLNVNLKLSAE